MPNRSVGIGSNAVAMTEREILRTKDLALPTSAASYRGWRNSFVTKCCSIDLTGEDLVLQWIQKAFEYSANGGELLNSGMLPRLDAHVASLLADSKHLKSEIGLTFQSYIEQCQMSGRSPKRRYMLYLIAQQFRLDMQRGSNLTEQALLELDIENYGYEGLKGFVEKTVSIFSTQFLLNISQVNVPNLHGSSKDSRDANQLQDILTRFVTLQKIPIVGHSLSYLTS